MGRVFGHYEVALGKVEAQAAGEQAIKVRPRDAQTWKAMNLLWVRLKK